MTQIASDKVLKILDFDYVLEQISPVTPYGRENKKGMGPFARGREKELREHLDRLEAVLGAITENRLAFIEVRTVMQAMKDLRHSIYRASKGICLSTVELFELKVFLLQIRRISDSLAPIRRRLPQQFAVTPVEYLERLLDPEAAGAKSFYIYDNYSDALKGIRKKKRALEADFNLMQKEQVGKAQQDLGLNFRPNGEITVSKNQKELLDTIKGYPGLTYLLESYINITFKIKGTPAMDRIAEKVEGLREMEQKEEEKIRVWLTGEVAGYSEELLECASAIGRLDFYIALAYYAREVDGVKPSIVDRDMDSAEDGKEGQGQTTAGCPNVISIKNGRHPLVAERLEERGEIFQPVCIAAGEGVTVITGANMGGKSVALKMAGLLSLMAQYGIFVPAQEMVIQLRDFVYVSMGDTQSVEAGLSTFGAEILDMVEALEKSDRHGLILIDELARGTNPKEGHAICAAIVKYLARKNSICILTTHFEGIGGMDGTTHLQVGGLKEADMEELSAIVAQYPRRGVEIIRKHMDYNLYRVGKNTRVPEDAVKVAGLMGLRQDILEDARRMLDNL